MRRRRSPTLRSGLSDPYIEMGEEPDGKHAMPRTTPRSISSGPRLFIRSIRNLVRGPVFEGVNEDITVWPDAKGRISWMGRFVDYLKEHGRIADLSFVSFDIRLTGATLLGRRCIASRNW